MTASPSILEIAIPSPLKRSFDYLLEPINGPQTLDLLTPPPQNNSHTDLRKKPLIPGIRIIVPFGGRQMVGILINVKNHSEIETQKLKSIIEVIDEVPILSNTLLRMMLWAADYYQHPLGEALHTAMPAPLRKGHALIGLEERYWHLTNEGQDAQLKHAAKKQNSIIAYLKRHKKFADKQKHALGFGPSSIKSLQQKGYIKEKLELPSSTKIHTHVSSLHLNQEQQHIIDEFKSTPMTYQAYLLEGVTGSGKTEVYLQLIQQVLEQGKQALVLVPEIGLTPQTLQRFKDRFNCPLAIFHSNISDKQRLTFWQQAQSGFARIIIGTRSALFTAANDLGIIIIDEEHDLSYKQQDGLRYSARDLACVRAKLDDIPVVLGTATPSLETLNNACSGRFHHWFLNERAGNASPPAIEIVDIRQQTMLEGVAESALEQIRHCLERGEQTLIFINRRGFAPSLICHSCGWVSNCNACDARLTIHLKAGHLRCHHCQAIEPIPQQCPECNSAELMYQGIGTERLAMGMQQQFPGVPVFRIDRDTTTSKHALPEMVEKIHSKQAAILVGTQMLAKGHHFPNVTLVVILEADSALMGIDYRASERFGQLLTQVIGRAGRAEKPGTAIIQSHYPEHPQLQNLVLSGYNRFAMDLLSERQQLELPPFSFHALVRLESQDANQAQTLLNQMKAQLNGLACISLGPFPAALQRRAHYFRYQLLLQANKRSLLKQALAIITQHAEILIRSPKIRFSIDVDPQDMA